MPPVDLSALTPAQQVRVAILCAWEVCNDPIWRRWATAWLDGSDRSAESAARAAAWASAWKSAWAVASAAAWANESTWAAWAVECAMATGTPLDLPAIIRRAVAEEPADAT